MSSGGKRRAASPEIIVANAPQFDLCYAIADLASPAPLLSPEVFAVPLGAPWLDGARAFGWGRWLAVPHLVDSNPPAGSVAEFLRELAATDPRTVPHRLHRALVHSKTRKPALRRKIEWLHFTGLRDKGPDHPGDGGAAELEAIVTVLGAFAPYLERALGMRRKHLAAIADRARAVAGERSLQAIIDEFRLPIEMDARSERLRALRGGAEVLVGDVGRVYLVPSAFNVRRLWNTVDSQLPASVILSIGEVQQADLAAEPAAGRIDPWLACKAIGDPMRAAMLRMIAKRPQTASDLASGLSLTKATVSHHIFHLREAGLLIEQRDGRSVRLAIDLRAIRAISAALAAELGPRRSQKS